MAYSNINKDKAQVKPGGKIKRAAIAAVLVILTVSAWINIWQQVITLKEARKRNQEAFDKITQLELEDKKLGKQIEDATGSAYQEQNVREDLGLGGMTDHWLLVDLGNTNLTPAAEIPESGTETTIRQWWNLFVR